MSWYPPAPKRRPGSGPWRAAGKRPFGGRHGGAGLGRRRSSSGRGSTRTGCLAAGPMPEREPSGSWRSEPARSWLPCRVPRRAVHRDRAGSHVLGKGVGTDAGGACQPGRSPRSVARRGDAAGVADDLAAAKIDLLPSRARSAALLVPRLGGPCKHSAAVCYLVADTLDEDPFLLFLMRGRETGTACSRGFVPGGRRRGRVSRPAGRGRRGGRIAPPHPRFRARHDRAGPPVFNASRTCGRGGASVSIDGSPPVPAIPLPPSEPGRPTVWRRIRPRVRGSPQRHFDDWRATPAQRAWELAHGVRSTALSSRWARILPAGRRRCSLRAAGGRIVELASLAACQPRPLSARRWRGGTAAARASSFCSRVGRAP